MFLEEVSPKHFESVSLLESFLRQSRDDTFVESLSEASQLLLSPQGRTVLGGYRLRLSTAKTIASPLCPGLSRVLAELLHSSRDREPAMAGTAVAVWNEVVMARWSRVAGFQLLIEGDTVAAAAGPETTVVSLSEYLDLFLSGLPADFRFSHAEVTGRRMSVRAVSADGRGVVFVADEASREAVRVFVAVVVADEWYLFPSSRSCRRGSRFLSNLSRRLIRAAAADRRPAVSEAAGCVLWRGVSGDQYVTRLSASLRKTKSLLPEVADAAAARVAVFKSVAECQQITRLDVASVVSSLASGYVLPVREVAEVLAAEICLRGLEV